MQHHAARGSGRIIRTTRTSRTTVQDTVAVLGLAFIFYLMLSSVAASKEPDWSLFWFAAALLICGIFFYGRCMRAILELLDDLRAGDGVEDVGRGAD